MTQLARWEEPVADSSAAKKINADAQPGRATIDDTRDEFEKASELGLAT
jgi:hypothetical protein